MTYTFTHMAYKRKRVSSTPRYLKRPTKKARKVRFAGRAGIQRVVSNMLNRNIETKENSRQCSLQAIPHNNVRVLTESTGATPLNIFYLGNNTGDASMQNDGGRIGDQITVKGVTIKVFLELPLNRTKVYVRLMLLKGAKGETFSRANIFKQKSANKMIDVINTERFSIIAQKICTLQTANAAPTTLLTIEGVTQGHPSGTTGAGIATKLVTMWIPGRKFGRGGTVQYENLSPNQVKFFDYRLVAVAYDWNGTPQDINTVCNINECFSCVYFKDA